MTAIGEIIYPCREMETRHCPLSFNGPCGEKPCARFESDDETPWLPEQYMSSYEKARYSRRQL
jgi:hypothetical protein